MCWMSKNIPTILTADKDIKVYKVLYLTEDGEYTSMYMDYSYVQGRTENEVALRVWEGMMYTISRGYHSYANNVKFEIKPETNSLFVYTSYGAYLDNTVINLYDGKKACICEFVIPKGTRYYKNEYEEIVSETIKFVGEVKLQLFMDMNP